VKYLIAFLLLTSTAFAYPADPGFYRVYDGLFMGTGTGDGTEEDIFRDVGLDVFELTTLEMPGWNVSNGLLSATVNDTWGGLWAYSDGMNLPDLLVVGVEDAWAAYCVRDWTWEDCPAGTVDITGSWSTDDLGGERVTYLSLFQARGPVNRSCDVPEPSALVMILILVVCVAIFIALARGV